MTKRLPICGGGAESLLSVFARLGFCLDLCLAGGVSLLLDGFNKVFITEEQLGKLKRHLKLSSSCGAPAESTSLLAKWSPSRILFMSWRLSICVVLMSCP
jgi:hypothetical protein